VRWAKEKESVQREELPGVAIGGYVLDKLHQYIDVQRGMVQFGGADTQRIETNVIESWIDFAFPVR
jgi:hypothetical protein